MMQHKLDNGEHCLVTITHKYGEPGHSPVQHVDSMHSAIERLLDGNIFSPYDLFELLRNYKSPKMGKFDLIRLVPADFKDFHPYSHQLFLKGHFNFNALRQVIIIFNF